jgi:hypothetical protein
MVIKRSMGPKNADDAANDSGADTTRSNGMNMRLSYPLGAIILIKAYFGTVRKRADLHYFLECKYRYR